MYEYKATVIKVIDGDTADFLIQLGFNITIKERCRFFGIDTPETRTRDKKEKAKGLAAKKFVKDTIEGKEVMIKTVKKGKFGRYLAEVFIEGHVMSLNKILVKLGHAKEYFGGRRG